MIKETGNLYKFDKDGYLDADCNHNPLPTKWIEAVSFVVANYDKTHIHSIYARGSVASGNVYDNISDIDLILVYNIETHIKDIYPSKNDLKEYHNKLEELTMNMYPFVAGVDFGRPLDSKFIRSHIEFAIKHLSKWLHGINLQESINRFKQEDIPLPYTNYQESLDHFEQDKRDSKWMAKRILRVGFILVSKLTEENVWTRDLFYCYKIFSDHYTNKEPEMKRMLEIVISGENTEQAKTDVLIFGYWLQHILRDNKILEYE